MPLKGPSRRPHWNTRTKFFGICIPELIWTWLIVRLSFWGGYTIIWMTMENERRRLALGPPEYAAIRQDVEGISSPMSQSVLISCLLKSFPGLQARKRISVRQATW